MKKILISLIAILSVLGSSAQKKNKIEISLSQYKFSNRLPWQTDDLIEIATIGYHRKVSNKVSLFTQFSKTPINSMLMVNEYPWLSKEAIGKIESRGEFNYYDLGISYRIYKNHRHNFFINAGVSYAYGTNWYLKYSVWSVPDPVSWDPTGHPIAAEYEQKKEGYFGTLSGIRYDYTFWKNRLNAGLNFDARQYAGGFPFQVNYGLHLGFNF